MQIVRRFARMATMLADGAVLETGSPDAVMNSPKFYAPPENGARLHHEQPFLKRQQGNRLIDFSWKLAKGVEPSTLALARSQRRARYLSGQFL
jgi:hypothetical protein